MSARRGLSGKGGRGGGKGPSTPLDRGDNHDGRSGPAAATTATTATPGGNNSNGGCGAPIRFGHFAKYTKPKIGLAFQCAVPKFVPPNAKEGGGVDNLGDAGDSESGSGSTNGGHATRSTSKGGKGGNKRGGRGGRGGKGGRGKGGRGRGGRGGGESMSKVEQSIASGETSAVDIANAAADQFEDSYDGSMRSIPRGGLCIHRPLWHQAKLKVRNNPAAGLSSEAEVATSLPSPSQSNDRRLQPQRLMDEHEDYLTYTRNLYLQTPRPHSELSIDEIWDSATAKKFKVETPATVPKSGKGGRARGSKRKAAAAALSMNLEDDGSVVGSVPLTQPKSVPVENNEKPEKVITSMDVEQSLSIVAQAAKLESHDQETSELLPLCGLESDEQALCYLQANYHGDLQKAKLSIMVKSDRGYGVQRRRQLKKKRKEANESYPDATTFTSESWRWRVHQARPTMLGDFRCSRDPTYNYFDPSTIEEKDLLKGSKPWRLLPRFGDDSDEDDEKMPADAAQEEHRPPARPRSFSISWSDEEIETAKRIWKDILAYTKVILGSVSEVRDNQSKPPLCDLLELVGKAHALPTPEETFGRRDPSARHMSENMNSIIDSIERGRDCVARILKCLKDDGEGIELDLLRKSMEEIESSCPVGLSELEAVKLQLAEASCWEEKLETNVDHNTGADSDEAAGSDNGELDVITEKKLTLEKVEQLVSKGRNLTLRPRSLIRLQSRVEKAHILRRRISVWNEARNNENPQNIKFISQLIKQANKVDLAFPELFTLTGVHKKAEEWMDRASIAVRTTISFEELEELVTVGEGLPLNVSDVLEKLQNRLKQAKEWMERLECIVPKAEDYLMWLRRFRSALEDSENNAHLLSLLSEGSRIPVTMDCSKLLQIEIDARHWSSKSRLWIPQSLMNGSPTEAASGDSSVMGCSETGIASREISAPQKRGKIIDVKDHLDRASSIRDRLWFGEKERAEWALEGEAQLHQMIKMSQTWFKKYNDIINYDSRRNGKLRISMTKLHSIVEEANSIPLNLGNPSTKMNRMFSQADEWMQSHYLIIRRCGIECGYVPAHSADQMQVEATKPLKIAELSAAVDAAESDLTIDLEVLVQMREHLEKARIWIDRINVVAPKKDSRRKSKKGDQQKHSMKELSDLIDQSSSVMVDIGDELGRLKLEQSTMMSWRLQAQQTLREIIGAFVNFRKERIDVRSGELSNPTSDTVTPAADPVPVANSIMSGGSMTTRNINSRRRTASSVSNTSGSETPASYTETGGKGLFPLVSSFLKSVKTVNILTPEGTVSDELSEVTGWFTKTFKLMNSPEDIYDRRNFSKLDKQIEAGQKLVKFDGITTTTEENIPEDTKKLIADLKQGWAGAVSDDVGRLVDLQNQRNKFVEWCEKADGIISSTDKKVSIETLKELETQSTNFPSSSEIVFRVRKRAKDATAWVSSVADIVENDQKISLDEAKAMTDAADKLNISCQEYKTLRTGLRATRGWLLRVKKCGAANGQGQVAANLVTELINEHNTFLVTAMDAFAELKQVMCGYCVCREPYSGFMIGCDGCEEWYHGPCVGISQEQAQKFDKYVCVRCSTLRVYKDNAATVAGILRKWTSAKGLGKARSGDSQRYGRKVRSAERDIVKGKADLAKHERELNSILGLTPSTEPSPPQINGEAVASGVPPQSPGANSNLAGPSPATGKVLKTEKALRDKIGKAHTTIGNCEKRMEGYKVELVERKNLEASEDSLALNMKKWCTMVKREVFSPLTKEMAESSRPRSDGSTSAPMDTAKTYAETLDIANLPDIDAVLNSFKIFSWCLHSLGTLMRKPRVDEIRALLSHSDSGYFKLPEAKCVRMLRSMSSRAQIWQSKVKKALAPAPGEVKPYDLLVLRELLLGAKQIPLMMPEETRLWSTIEDGGNRHCICGGPGDGSFMLGCDSCDRWFHGSCVKIDKETGDALSNWICPLCSKSVSVEANTVLAVAATGEEKLPAQQEIITTPLSLVSQPHLDISPHAPNPANLWPPFGLRSCKCAVEALGKEGESDNEDFEAPIQQPIARVKSDSLNAHPQNRVAQVASAKSSISTAPGTFSNVTLCQPISAPVKPSSTDDYHKKTTASLAATSSSATPTQRFSNVPVCQPIATVKSYSNNAYQQNYAPPTASVAMSSARSYPQAITNRSHPRQPMSLNTNHRAIASIHMPHPQSSRQNTLTSNIPYATHSGHPMPGRMGTMGLNRANLAAVANMDAYVVGEGSSLQHQVAAAPAPLPPRQLPPGTIMQQAAPMRSANVVQPYATAAVPQAGRKAP